MRSPLIELLAHELAPTEGRAQAVLRIATACAITVAIAMVFQIPEPPYMAYVVFLISKDEGSATLTTGIGAMLAVTLAAFLNLGFLLIDTAEPAVRLPAMALATFIAMFSVRTFALGPVSYLAGFVVVLLQSVVDDIPSPEKLLRLGLWVWVVVLIPIVTIVTVNLAFAPASKVLVGRTWRRILAELESGLNSRITKADLARWREATLPLLGKLDAAERLLEVLTILEVLPETRPRDAGPKLPAEIALQRALTAMYEASQRTSTSSPRAEPPKHEQLFVPDAFSNPAHWQFALKTTLAVMVVYVTYTLLNYPTMRTSVVTCFFVALGSLGETVHKLTLRVSGAIIGGLVAGICIVWVLPHMTDIGQLCALVAIVSAGAGWIATSSERLSYAGMQMAFAFFLGVLQGYAPATDLSLLRDRVAGILLGNIVIALIFSTLWPESSRSRLRTALTDALRAVADLLAISGKAGESRIRATQALVQSQHYAELSAFELQMLPAEAGRDTAALEGVRRVAGAAFVATSDAFASLPEDERQSRISSARSAAEKLSSEIAHAAAISR